MPGRLGDLIGDKLPIGQEIPKDLDPAKIGDTIGDTIGGAVGDLLGKDNSADKDDPEKKDARDVLKDIGGLFGGDKSKDKDENDAP